MPGARRIALVTSASLAMLALAGFAYLRLWGITLQFTEAELQQHLAMQLPLTHEVRRVQATLQNPRIQLVEGSDRVRVGLDVAVAVPLGGIAATMGAGTLRWQGAVNASTAVRYEADTGQLFLATPAVEQLVLPGVPERFVAASEQIVTSALQAFYASRPVYTLTAKDAKGLAARLLLKQAQVRDGVLVVELGL